MLCIVVGCTQNSLAPELLSKEGSLTVTISATSATRATTPGDGNIYMGGGMEDVTLVLVSSMGTISEIQHIGALTGEEQRVKSVVFSNLDVGNYVLYAYANTQRALLGEARDMLSSLVVGDVFDGSYYDALFATLSNRATPVVDDSHPMLLTASKPLAVGVENSSTSIDLMRPVVWFEVVLYNHSDYPMQVEDVSFSNFNPSTGYILPKEGALPLSVVYRGLPLYSTYTGGVDVTVAAHSESCIYETFLFENRAPSYTMNLAVKVGGELTTVTSMSTTGTYALKNRSTGRYLIDNGAGSMAVVASVDAAPSLEHALWRFSSTSSGYLTNVATGRRYYQSTTAANSGSNLSFTKSGNYYRVSYYNRSTYYLRDNNGSATFTTGNAQTRDWTLQELSQKTATISDRQISVVDMQTAAVVPMTEQVRNQHVKIVINAYFNNTDGEFNFVVLPWEEKNEDVEFN